MSEITAGERRAGMHYLSSKLGLNRRVFRDLLRRIDRAAADLNVLLVVIAIGLAALNLTFLATQRVVERLPQVTRVIHVPPPATP